jgi:endonuclease YncB( thermonuclease family)
MASGLLEVVGTLDVAQFWPVGGSDADTSQLKVDVAAGAFRFRPNPNTPFRVTRAFDNAKVHGAAVYDAVRNGRITVRLQGLDAPELHYQPASALTDRQGRTEEQKRLYLEWNLEYRQFLAETSTLALTGMLAGRGTSPLPCVVRTAVDTPGEVFDVYGRVVADVYVPGEGGELNVNQWLMQRGWVYPAFYASMSADEILTLTELANEAYYDARGVWTLLHDTARATDFDFGLVYRGRNARPAPDVDQGLVVLPKLFRRLAEYAVNRRAKMVTGTFESFLRAKRSGDGVHLTPEFLDFGPTAAPVRYLDEFVTNGYVTVWPEQIVFREKPSRVTGPGGAPVVF